MSPTPVYSSVTAGALIPLLADRVGDNLAEGTASSGSTTTIVDTSADSGLIKFDTTDDPELVGANGIIVAGTGIGGQRRVSALNITTLTATVSVAYAATLDNTSQYVFTKRWDVTQYLQALKQAQRQLTYEPSLHKGVMKETGPLRHIQLGNALLNALFDLFTTSNAPDSWTTTNMTATSETTVTYGGCRRSLKLITDGANVANLTQSLTMVGQYPASFEVYAWVWCETASELFIRVNDGVDNHDSTTKHDGKGWNKLRVTVTPSAAAAAGTDAMTCAIRSTTAGSTITFYVQNIWFPRATQTDHRYALDADIGLVVLNPEITVLGKLTDSPSGNAGKPYKRIREQSWEIDRSTTRQIVLHIGSEYNGNVIELNGWQAHTAIASASTTWAGPIDAILDMAEVILHKQKVSPQQQPSIRQAGSSESAGDTETVRLRTIAKYGVPIPNNVKVVESII